MHSTVGGIEAFNFQDFSWEPMMIYLMSVADPIDLWCPGKSQRFRILEMTGRDFLGRVR